MGIFPIPQSTVIRSLLSNLSSGLPTHSPSSVHTPITFIRWTVANLQLHFSRHGKADIWILLHRRLPPPLTSCPWLQSGFPTQSIIFARRLALSIVEQLLLIFSRTGLLPLWSQSLQCLRWASHNLLYAISSAFQSLRTTSSVPRDPTAWATPSLSSSCLAAPCPLQLFASGMCPMPCFSFEFTAAQQWPSELIWFFVFRGVFVGSQHDLAHLSEH